MSSFQREIQEQPTALAATIEAIATTLAARQPRFTDWASQSNRLVIFTGMGASFNAALPAVITLAERGIKALAIESADLLYEYRGLIDPGVLLVAISQSGESIEMRRLVESVQGICPIIAITNNPESTLAKAGEIVLETRGGQEISVALKTYTCALAAVSLLSHALGGLSVLDCRTALLDAVKQIETYLPRWAQESREFAASVKDTRYFTFLGRGVSKASALGSALLFKESAKLFTEGMSPALYRHGPIETLSPDSLIILFAGAPPTAEINMQLMHDLDKLGARLALVGGDQHAAANVLAIPLPPLPAFALPIAEIIPMQIAAAHLSEARGIDTDTFRFIKKIATHE